MLNRTTRFMALMLLLVPLFVLVGCSSDDSSPVEPSQALTTAETEDVADDFSSTLADPQEGILPLWLDGGVMTAEAPSDIKDGTPAIADTMVRENRFFTITRIRNYYDAEGNRSDTYDPETTVAMERLISMAGTHTNRDSSRVATIEHQDSTWVDGIAPEDTIRTLNGAGSRHNEASWTSRFRQMSSTMEATYSWTVTDLEIARDRDTNPFLLSGTIAVEADIERSSSRPRGDMNMTRHTSFTVTFDGTQYAMVEMEDGTVYYIDLTLGRPHRHRP